MSRQQDLAKNTVILTFGKICTQFISFMLLPLYTALLQPEEFGTADLIASYVSLLVPLINWQIENGLFRYMIDCRNQYEKQKQLFTTVIVANVLQSVIFVALYLIVSDMITLAYKEFLVADVVLNIFLGTMLQLPRGLGDNKKYAIASLISSSTTVIFNVIFIAVLNMGVLGLFWATVVGKVITLAYLTGTLKAWRYVSVKTVNKGMFKELFRYSVPLVPNQLSWWAVTVSDRLVISHFLGVIANGIYTVAYKFPTMVTTFYNFFNMSWTESVSVHFHDEDRDEYIRNTIRSMFRLFSAICIGIIACIPFVFPILVNSQYASAYEHIPLLLLAMLFQVVTGLYSAIYVALKKSEELAKTSVYAAVINIVVNLALVKVIGLYAASVSTMVAYGVMALFRYFDIKKHINIALERNILIGTLVFVATTLVTYYQPNLWISAVNLLLVAIYAVCINKEILGTFVQMVISKLKKK